MDAHRMPRVFLKPAHGSSASGVVALETAGGGRLRAATSVERTEDGRLHNSLRVRRVTSEREAAALVDALAPDGLHVERWWPKASLDGAPADLRVVVVAGRATHAVVRTGRSPMTNLHLGGRRGDPAAVAAAAGPRWADALETCERAAACFPAPCASASTCSRRSAGAGSPSPRSTPSATSCPASPACPAAAPRAWTPTRPR